jgi:hypothetical protein
LTPCNEDVSEFIFFSFFFLIQKKLTIELAISYKGGQIVIHPDTELQSGINTIQLKTKYEKCNIRATLLIEIRYNCSICQVYNMDKVTYKEHQLTKTHLDKLENKLQCFSDIDLADYFSEFDDDEEQSQIIVPNDIYYTMKDGNCLFRSLAVQIYGDEKFHLLLRFTCYNHLSKHTDLGFDKEETLERIKNGYKWGEWAGDIETKIISEIYHFKIVTIDAKDKSIKQIFGQDDWMPLFVLYDENHYDSYLARQTPSLSDVFYKRHYDNPGTFEDIPATDDALDDVNKLYKINGTFWGEKKTKFYVGTIEDVVFANSDMMTTAIDENETQVFFKKRKDDSTLFYKLRFDDDDVAWFSHAIMLDSEAQHQTKRKKRRYFY